MPRHSNRKRGFAVSNRRSGKFCSSLVKAWYRTVQTYAFIENTNKTPVSGCYCLTFSPFHIARCPQVSAQGMTILDCHAHCKGTSVEIFSPHVENVVYLLHRQLAIKCNPRSLSLSLSVSISPYFLLHARNPRPPLRTAKSITICYTRHRLPGNGIRELQSALE